ncbi:ferrochelatase [Enterococcus sp. CSURQ0835]|uniref:ferrochelatase n=1 Tax=Enterococcus sp. CSURQ0835 TaxID=2681394 RepID=UPI00135CD4A0|nr:ferrochelatase [Enterococcus sp. CSURQ0835]
MKKKGILLINLGTPAAPEKKAVKQYLARFLSDRRVIKTPRFLWLPLLHGIILNTRPKKSARLYQKIWQADGSPLLIYAENQRQLLQERLPDTTVALAMSYSQPLIKNALAHLIEQGINELTVIPMYPQYSGTTVGSVFDDVMGFFRGQDTIIDLRFIRSFYDHPRYIAYYVEKIKQALTQHDVDAIVFSYHGIPADYVTAGDTYPTECAATTRLITSQLPEIPHFQSFQSKFGPGKWLTPATIELMQQLPNQGYQKILVVAPGFIADCLETVEELEQENKNHFLANGGQQFIYVPPFNADPELAMIFAELAQN